MLNTKYYAISGRDFTPVYQTGGTAIDQTKWYTIDCTVASNLHQIAVTYSSAVGIGAVYSKTATTGTTLPTGFITGSYKVWAFIKSFNAIGGYTRVNGGAWTTGGTNASTSKFTWVCLGTLSLKAGDLVEIQNEGGSSGGSTLIKDICFIDSTTYIAPNYVPTGTEGARYGNLPVKSSVSQMAVGDRIPCMYTSSAVNVIGTFSQLGTSTASEINGTAVPGSTPSGGTFYFIMVGYDTRGRRKLVADRSIQDPSWDVLNTAGISSGSGLPLSIDGGTGYTIRLMTGGASATDTEDEWDKIVVESNLNGTIVSGDPAVWNLAGSASWTSTRSTTYTVYRSTASDPTYRASMATSSRSGFRPVLLVEAPPLTLSLKELNPTHVYKVPCDMKVSINYTPQTTPGATTICDFNVTDANNINKVSGGDIALNGSASLSNNFTVPMINAVSIGSNISWEAPLDLTKLKSISKVEVI